MSTRKSDQMRNPHILNHYEQNEFKEWAYDVVERGFSPGERDYISLFPNHSAQILDIGCGGGRETLALMERGFEKIIGMDFSYKTCSVYKKRFARSKNIRVLNANGAFLPFADASFDYVFCLGNMVCFLDRKELRAGLVREIRRCLRPKGKALLSALGFEGRRVNALLYFLLSMLRRFQKNAPEGTNLPWLKKNGRLNRRFWRADEPQAYWFRNGEFERLLTESGLKIVPAPDGKKENAAGGLCCAVTKGEGDEQ